MDEPALDLGNLTL